MHVTLSVALKLSTSYVHIQHKTKFDVLEPFEYHTSNNKPKQDRINNNQKLYRPQCMFSMNEKRWWFFQIIQIY